MRPRYSLARCRFRYFETGTGGREQLRKAKEALGELDTNASVTSQVEWLAWSAKILAAMGDSKRSLDSVRLAHQLLSNEPVTAIEKQQHDEVTRFLADRLAVSDQQDHWKEAMALLSTIEAPPSSKTFWDAHVLRCELLHRTKRYEDFARELLSPDVRVVLNQVRRSPRDVMAQLASLSFQLGALAFPPGLGDPPMLKPNTASKCLEYLKSILTQTDSIVQTDEVLQAYGAILNANLNADPTNALRENVTAYTEALQGRGTDSIQPNTKVDARRFLLKLFTYYFFPAASQRSRARTELVAQLQTLSLKLRKQMMEEMNQLLSSGVVLNADEKQAVELLPNYFGQIPPKASP